MFKRIIMGLFAVLIPVCILSFAAAGVLSIFQNDGSNTTSVAEYGYYESFIISQTGKNYGFTIPAKDYLEFKLSAMNVKIMESYEDNISIRVINDNVDKEAEIVLEVKDNVSMIDIHPNDYIFDPQKCSVLIYVPYRSYFSLSVEQDSGEVEINEVIAAYNSMDIRSGNFSFTKSKKHTSTNINVTLRSGKAELNNLNTGSFSFNVSSGELEASGLCGTGHVNSDNSDVTLSFTDEYGEYYGLFLDEKEGGTLNIFVPQSSAFGITPTVDSGRIKIETDNANETIKESIGEKLFYGDEETKNFFYLKNKSGNIDIKNKYTVPNISDPLYENTQSSSSSAEYSTGIFSQNEDATEDSSGKPSDPDFWGNTESLPE